MSTGPREKVQLTVYGGVVIRSSVVQALKSRISLSTVPLFFVVLIGFMPINLLAKDKVFDFSIPAQRADISLTEYARITGRKILFPFDLVSKSQTNRLEGNHSADKAIELLLSGTDLLLTTYSYGSGTIIRNQKRFGCVATDLSNNLLQCFPLKYHNTLLPGQLFLNSNGINRLQ